MSAYIVLRTIPPVHWR